MGKRWAACGAHAARLHVSIRQPVAPSLEATSIDLSVGTFGSITVTFNQLFKDFTVGAQTPAAVSMEQFTLLHLITAGSIA